LFGGASACNPAGVGQICDAIRSRTLIEFRYHGLIRLVAPYCHGYSARGVEVVRAVQVGGSSSSRGFGFGKLWVVADIDGLRLTGKHFEPKDPHYNPNDRGMQRIHCRI
jgi:hypothetical protein